MPPRFRYSLLGARFTRSCNVIDYVTNRFPIGQFLLVVHWNRSSISCRFKTFASKYIWVTILTFWGRLMLSVIWDNGPQTFWGHELDLYRSLDVIGHVTNRFPIGHLLWLSIDTQALSLNVFEIFDPKVPCAHTDTRRKWFYYRAMHFSAYARSWDRMSSVRLSVCPSVCPSVTLVDCDHIGWKSWKLITRTTSPTPSLFVAKRRFTQSQGNMGKFRGD